MSQKHRETEREYETFPKCCHWEVDLKAHRETCLLNYGAKLLIDNEKCSGCEKKRKETYVVPKPFILDGRLPKDEPEWTVLCYFCGMLRVTNAFTENAHLPRHKVLSKVVKIYCDGGLVAMNKYGGTWAWCGVDKDGKRVVGNAGFVLGPPSEPEDRDWPTKAVTNNHTEQIAIIKALEEMPQGWNGIVVSDSKIALGRMFGRDWATKNLPQNIIDRGRAAVARIHPVVKYQNIQGHPTEDDLRCGIGKKRNKPVSIHNVWCDWECEGQRLEYFKIYDIYGKLRDPKIPVAKPEDTREIPDWLQDA